MGFVGVIVPTILLLFLLIIALIYIISLRKQPKEYVKEADYYKFNLNKSIPKNIIVSIADKEILSDPKNKISKIIQKTIDEFSEFNVQVYDDNDCYELVKSFGDPLLTACYEEIIPGAYKCDIFRLVALYKFGGVYVDTGREMNAKAVKSLVAENEMIFCRDRGSLLSLFDKNARNMVYTGFIASVKNNMFFLKLLERIKNNISNFNYGRNTLDVTGPYLVGKVYKEYFGYYCNQGQQFDKIYVLKDRNSTRISTENKNFLVVQSKVRDKLGKNVSNSYKSQDRYTYAYKQKKIFYQLTHSDWHKSAKNYYIDKKGYLCADLRNNKGKYEFSKIKYEPYTKYKNLNGIFVKR